MMQRFLWHQLVCEFYI